MMRILIIEDNEEDQKFLTEFLTPYATRVIVKDDGEEALKLIYQVDLVILDLNLMTLSGKDVLKKIKKKRKSLPVIVYSTSENPEEITYCYENGVACYITKPFGLRETIHRLQSLGQFWKEVSYAS